MHKQRQTFMGVNLWQEEHTICSVGDKKNPTKVQLVGWLTIRLDDL